MSGVVTIGETMALLGATGFGPLQHEKSLNLAIGGSESNVAIALSRLGTEATWIGKVGADPLGELILREIRAEGVHVEAVIDPEAPTSLMLKERRSRERTSVYYYRRGNAGGRLRFSEINADTIRGAALLHVTGISPALSPGMTATIREAVQTARDAEVPVSLDLNFRSSLWSQEAAAAEYGHLIPLADIVFAGDDEAAIAVGEPTDPEASRIPFLLAHRLIASGAKSAVIKLGAEGAVAVVGGLEYQRDAVRIDPVDTVGAGDAFVAGYLSEHLRGADVTSCLTTAVTAGAYACLVPGDWEGAPRRSELALLGAGGDPVAR
jgi:2-dehydro-3-deoxygluconokinase